MAQFGVAVVLDDPKLQTPFIVRKYTRTMVKGRSVDTYVDYPRIGVVVPLGSASSTPLGMNRTSESEAQGSNLTVYARDAISTGDGQNPADNIIFHDQLYQVNSSNDYSEYGFWEVMAVLIEPGGRRVV